MKLSTGTGVPVAQIIHPVPVQTWREVLAADPDAMAQQTPEYATAVRRVTGGHDASRLYVLGDGRRLVLPLVGRAPLPGVRWEAAFPTGYGHGGLLAEGGLRPSDLELVVADLRRGGSLSAGLDGHHHTAERWAASGVQRFDGVSEHRRRVDVIDLSDGYDALVRDGFSRGARSNLRRAERKGVELESAVGGRLVPLYYRIYLDWVEERLASSALPAPVGRHLARRRDSLAKIQTVADQVGEDCRITIAWHGGEPVAGSITLVHGACATGWRTCSVKALAAPVAANTYVHAAEFRDAVDSGCRYFDLGQSSDVPGLLEYKRSLGGHPRDVVDFRVEPAAVTRVRGWKTRGQDRLGRALSSRPLSPTRRK